MRRESIPRRLRPVPEPAPPPRPPLPMLYALGAYAQALLILPSMAAPFVAKEFGLADRDLAVLTGAMSLSAFGALALSRLADRRGRRAALRLSFAGLGPTLLATALAPVAWLYAAAQIAAGSLHGALRMVSVVAITEVSDENARARGQSWYGLLAALGSGVPLGLVALFGDRPNGWRLCFALMSASVLALPWVWRHAPETGRFEIGARAWPRAARPHARPARAALPAPRGRPRVRGAACAARGSARSASTSSTTRSRTSGSSRGPSRSCSSAAARSATSATRPARSPPSAGAGGRRRWSSSLLTVLGGVAYYLVPAGLGLATPILLSLAFFVFVFSVQAFGVADRLVDTELFPTALRTSYAGLRLIVEAGATALGNFGLAACIALFGSLGLAMAVLVPALVVPGAGDLLVGHHRDARHGARPGGAGGNGLHHRLR